MKARVLDRSISHSLDGVMRRVQLKLETDFGVFAVSLDGPVATTDLTVREVRPWEQVWLTGVTYSQKAFIAKCAMELADVPMSKGTLS